jgi:hypothetical protein
MFGQEENVVWLFSLGFPCSLTHAFEKNQT